jgi:hypothetical protein
MKVEPINGSSSTQVNYQQWLKLQSENAAKSKAATLAAIKRKNAADGHHQGDPEQADGEDVEGNSESA